MPLRQFSFYDGSITPDADEIAEGRFFTFNEINEKLNSGIFTPNLCLEFKKVEAFVKSHHLF